MFNINIILFENKIKIKCNKKNIFNIITKVFKFD